MQFVPASFLYILSAVVSFILAYYTWRIKPERGLIWVMVMFSAGLWATGSALETFPTDVDIKFRIITTITYLGIISTVFFWSLFTIIYSHHEHWLNKFTISLLAVVPVISYLLIFTSPYHSFVWESYWPIEINGFVFFDKIYGVGFWIWSVYAYLVILLGSVLLITAVIRSPRLYQGQAFMLILGAIIPLFSNLLFLTNLNPIAPLDISPISLTLTGIFITIGMLRFRLFSVLPVAHDQVFKGVTSGVIVIDLKGQIIDLNPAAEAIINQKQDTLIGENVFTLFPDNRALIKQFENIWDAKTEISFGSENRIYELQIMPLTNRSGSQVSGRIILLLDVTERNQALAERDRLIKELDAYAHTVAHDLKTPLSVITGYSGLIQNKEQDVLSDFALKYLDVIDQTSQKMGEIIDSLLLLANINSMDKVELRPLDMNTIVNNAWIRVQKNYQDTEIEFKLPDISWPTAVGFAPWVEQIWVNYLSNAVKYGGSPPHIEAGFDENEKSANGTRPFVRFWVKDNGAGLSKEEVDQLFQEFVRLAQHQSVGGHGLGLSIVQRIAERLGGQVGLESEPNQGSTFYFTLPLAINGQSPISKTDQAIKQIQ